jgi:hypothetical protein
VDQKVELWLRYQDNWATPCSRVEKVIDTFI